MISQDEYIHWLWDQYETGQINDTQLNYLVECQGISAYDMQRVYNLRQTIKAVKLLFIFALVMLLFRMFFYH